MAVHRKSSKSGEDVYRMVLEVPSGEEIVSLEPWKSVLTTPELRQEWDPAVEDAHLLETFDRSTRISKTNYTLGWPAKFVMISFTLPFPLMIAIALETPLRYLEHSMILRHSLISPPPYQGRRTNQRIFDLHLPLLDLMSIVRLFTYLYCCLN